MIILQKMKISYSLIILIVFSLFSGFIKELLIVYGCIIFHEFGHIFFLKLFKESIISFKLSVFGGIVKTQGLKMSKIQKFLVNIGRNYYKSINHNFCFSF